MAGDQNMALPDSLIVIVSRDDIEAANITAPLKTLTRLLERDAAVRFRESVEIGVHGYDSDVRELYEIPEVRDFMYKLDMEFPYWCYFLSTKATGLAWVVSCFCPPYLTPEAKAEIWPKRIGGYLERRGFPAMNRMCEITGVSESEIQEMSKRILGYFFTSPKAPSGDKSSPT
jgi:hypothetical protein